MQGWGEGSLGCSTGQRSRGRGVISSYGAAVRMVVMPACLSQLKQTSCQMIPDIPLMCRKLHDSWQTSKLSQAASLHKEKLSVKPSFRPTPQAAAVLRVRPNQSALSDSSSAKVVKAVPSFSTQSSCQPPKPPQLTSKPSFPTSKFSFPTSSY